MHSNQCKQMAQERESVHATVNWHDGYSSIFICRIHVTAASSIKYDTTAVIQNL